MQTIKHEVGYKNIHPLMDEIEQLYRVVSDESDTKGLFRLSLDNSIKHIYDVCVRNVSRSFEFLDFKEEAIEPLELPKYDPKNIIVCFSGGKDSFSVIRHYQKMGYHVYPYHVVGLNKTYTDEWKIAKELAERLGLTLYLDKVSYSGQHLWIEHPLKNMIMLNMALTYGIREGITTRIAVGTFRSSYLVDSPFEVCAGDCIDMWHYYEAVIRRFIPKFKVFVPNLNFHTAYNAILKEPEYLPYTVSCLTPNRFRNQFRERTIKNYALPYLMPNRCGCCWKCATEYIFFCDHGILDYYENYYIHCLEVLLHTMEQEIGYKIYSVEYVWGHYFFYPMTKSKAREKLKNAFIQSGKIKITDKDIEG